jgi:WD40 repeat protein
MMLGSLWQGDNLISIALSGEVYYLDQNFPEKPKKVVHGHNKFITALAYDSANKHLYSGSYDASIVQWDVSSGNTQVFSGKGHGNQVNSMSIQGGNLVTCAMDDTVRITPTGSRQYSAEGVKLDSTPAAVTVGKRDTKLVVAVIVDSVVVIKDGRVVNKQAVKYQPTTVALSVDETKVAVGGKDNNVYVYDLSGDKLTETATLKGHRGALTGLTYSPDGQWLASSDTNREILVWDTKSNQVKVQGWVFHTAKVNSLAWTPDSLHLASAGLDGNVYIWDVQRTDKRVQIKDAHRGGVNAVVWLDDNTVASAGQDCTIKTWTITFH